MKVLIIGPSIERTKGGMATVIQGQINSNLKAYGIEYEYIISHVEGSIFEKLQVFFKCLILVLIKKFDIAHIHMACYGSFYRKAVLVLLLKIRRKKIILHLHGADFDSFYTNSSFLVKLFIKTTFEGCKLIALSNYWKTFLEQNFKSKVEVVFNGINIEEYKQCISADNYSTFLFLGRLGQRKGVYDLLEAVNIIVKNKEFIIKVYLVGDGEVDNVNKIIGEYGLENNVVTTGWADNEQKKTYLKACGSIVLPSYNEGLPMTIIEAMACGKIIISTNVGGIPELIKQGENGYLFTPGNVDQLVEYMCFVASQKDEMHIISRNNILKGKQYSLDVINEKLVEIYRSLSSF